MEKILHNLKEIKDFAEDLADKVRPGQPVAFYGDLGSGKTTLIKFLAAELGVKEIVTSPTFVIEKRYRTGKGFALVHIDCYRLSDEKEAVNLGLADILSDENSLIVIEWAERIEKLLPKNTLKIHLKYLSENEREIDINF